MGAETLSLDEAKGLISTLEGVIELLNRRRAEIAYVEERIEAIPAEIDRIAKTDVAGDSVTITKKSKALSDARNELSALTAGLPSLQERLDDEDEEFRACVHRVSRAVRRQACREQRVLIDAAKVYCQPIWETLPAPTGGAPFFCKLSNQVERLAFTHYPKSDRPISILHDTSPQTIAVRLIEVLKDFCARDGKNLLEVPEFLRPILAA